MCHLGCLLLDRLIFFCTRNISFLSVYIFCFSFSLSLPLFGATRITVFHAKLYRILYFRWRLALTEVEYKENNLSECSFVCTCSC